MTSSTPTFLSKRPWPIAFAILAAVATPRSARISTSSKSSSIEASSLRLVRIEAKPSPIEPDERDRPSRSRVHQLRVCPARGGSPRALSGAVDSGAKASSCTGAERSGTEASSPPPRATRDGVAVSASGGGVCLRRDRRLWAARIAVLTIPQLPLPRRNAAASSIALSCCSTKSINWLHMNRCSHGFAFGGTSLTAFLDFHQRHRHQPSEHEPPSLKPRQPEP